MKKIVVLLGVLLFVHFSASAQINPLKRAQRKLEERLAKRAADKIEDAVDKKIDEKIDEKEKERKANGEDTEERSNRSIFDLDKMMGTGTPVDLPDSYEFTFQIDWIINSSQSKTPTEMTQLFAKDAASIGMEFDNGGRKNAPEKTRMVLDMEENYMVMLDDQSAKAMVIQMDGLEEIIDEEVEKEAEKVENDYKITKTSETKTIAGYPCVKYIYTSEESGNGEIWATEELSYENIDMYSYFNRMNKKKNATIDAYWNKGVKGFMLQVDMEDEKGNTTSMMATKVDQNANVTYSLDGYESMDLRGYSKMMGGSKK